MDVDAAYNARRGYAQLKTAILSFMIHIDYLNYYFIGFKIEFMELYYYFLRKEKKRDYHGTNTVVFL